MMNSAAVSGQMLQNRVGDIQKEILQMIADRTHDLNQKMVKLNVSQQVQSQKSEGIGQVLDLMA